MPASKSRQHAYIFRAVEREPYATVRDHAADIAKALPASSRRYRAAHGFRVTAQLRGKSIRVSVGANGGRASGTESVSCLLCERRQRSIFSSRLNCPPCHFTKSPINHRRRPPPKERKPPPPKSGRDGADRSGTGAGRKPPRSGAGCPPKPGCVAVVRVAVVEGSPEVCCRRRMGKGPGRV